MVEKKNKLAIVAFSGELDKAWPSMILATTAAASGMEVSVFFTFWGLNLLVKPEKRLTGTNWMQKGFALMNPPGMNRAKLSKLHMGGAGKKLLRRLAKQYKVAEPAELMEMAMDMGVKLQPCQMTMDLLGLKKEDMIDGLEPPLGAASAILEMKEAEVQFFI